MNIATTDLATGQLIARVVEDVNRARATGDISAMAALCVPSIFADVEQLDRALQSISVLDYRQTHPAPVELGVWAREVIVKESALSREIEAVGWTVLYGPDLVGALDGWMRIACGQWDGLPMLVGWTDTDEPRWSTWDFRWQFNEIRAMHAVHPFTYANCSQAISRAAEPVRRAYNVWKLLGGGVADRSLLQVDEPFRWDVQ